jgi:carbon-monoxide dehydrogenase small subunit
MKKIINLTVNGESFELAVEPNRTLADALREDLNFTGAKKGCGIGDCGACTVLMDGLPVFSCLVLAIEADGHDIMTIEGVADGAELHPIQKAFIEHGAIQCGFCTPGMILNAYALLKANPDPNEDDIRRALSGNLCRCTGYQKIVEAIQSAAKEMRQSVRTVEEYK